MARDLNGTSDQILYTLHSVQQSLDTVTYAFWVWADSYAVNYRKWIYLGTAGDREMAVEMDTGYGTPTGFVFVSKFDSTPGVWSINAGATGAWNHYCITYNWGATTNDPIIYLNGTSVTVTERLTPVGTRDNNNTSFYLGAEAGSNYFDGRLAEVSMWNRILTSTEAASLGAGISPRAIPDGLVFYTPLANGEAELIKGAVATVTGTTNIAHPPINYIKTKSNNLRPAIFTPGLAR